MAIVRILFIAMLLLSAGTYGLYIFTGKPRYRQQAIALFRWTVLALVLFFTVLVVQHV